MILLFAFSYQPNKVDIEETNLALSQAENELFLGTDRPLANLDPLNAWELGSFDVIDQVAEGLFGYDFTDPNLAIIPKLAAGYGTWDGNTYTVILRDDVVFHDGTPFNAYAVESTFVRLQYFMDHGMAVAGDLYKYYDLETDEMKPIINSVNVIDEYKVEFVLDSSYGLFETLLSFEGSFILSPTATPPEDYIDLYSSPLVGTGPFVYEYYDGVEVSFRAFENYRDGKADIDHLKIMYMEYADERGTALYDGHVHMILNPPTYRRGEFEGGDYIFDSIETTTMMYLGMNNYWINRSLREAISYAVDYDFLINDIYGGEATRLKSPVPNGIVYSDDSFNVATTNIIHAREIMQNLGYGTDLALDAAEWETSTFLSLNYSYNYGNTYREDLYPLLQDNLGKIGIEVLDAGMTGYEYSLRYMGIEGHFREELQLFWLGWGADYNDASNYINTQFTNRTGAFNIVGYNGFDSAIEAGRDPFNLDDNVQLLMEEALLETDPLLREQYYSRIQQLLVEEDMPWAYGIARIREIWYNSEVQGFQMNPLEKLNFYGVSGVTPEEQDTKPPVTGIFLEGDMPWPWSGWFVSDVLVTLEATDPSGVMLTWYTFDEGNTILFYTGPFWVNENTTFYYGSVDNLGNGEMPNYIEINIDKTLPTTEISLSGTEGMNGWYTSDVLVTLEAFDDISGVAGIGYTYNGVDIIPYTGPFLIEESATFYYGSVDNAGNYGASSMITIEIYKSPSAITDKIIEELENLDIPPGAQKDVDKALDDLQAAIDKFSDGKIFNGIHKIHKAIKHLMDALDDGAAVQSIINVLVEMVLNTIGKNNCLKAIMKIEQVLL